MTQADDYKTIRERWFKWNIHKEGEDRGSLGNKYSYNGPIFYSDNYAAQRLLLNKHDTWVLMCRYHTAVIPDWAKHVAVAITVPDIACFSIYPGDWYDEAESIHGRQKFIMLSRVNQLIEDAEAKTNKQYAENHREGDSVLKELDKYYTNWASYDDTFDLGWGRLPAHYREKVERLIKTKIAVWNDPAAVVRRQRQAARKAAKEALGLNAND